MGRLAAEEKSFLEWCRSKSYGDYAKAQFQLEQAKRDMGPVSRNDMATMLYGGPAVHLAQFRAEQLMVQPQSRKETKRMVQPQSRNETKTIKATKVMKLRKQTKSMQAVNAMKA